MTYTLICTENLTWLVQFVISHKLRNMHLVLNFIYHVFNAWRSSV